MCKRISASFFCYKVIFCNIVRVALFFFGGGAVNMDGKKFNPAQNVS